VTAGLSELLRALQPHKLRKTGSGWAACCPAHQDKRPSLSITEAANGNVLVKCHAGCRTEDVLVKLDLPMAVLFPDHGEPVATPLRTAPTTTEREIVYDYRDESARLGFQVVRQPGKNFRQRRPDGKGGWIWNLDGVGRVLYRLPELMATGTDRTVYVVEGEKDVETLRGLGEVATTNPGGAGKWRPEYTPALHGRHVVILPDNDDVGRKHGEDVARALTGAAASVKVVHLPGLAEKGDVSDWLAAGGTVADLQLLVRAAPALGTTSEIAGVSERPPKVPVVETNLWPAPIAREAFHGLVGGIVDAIEPHTESDPVAILVQLLAAIGNCVGRGPHFLVERTPHYPVIFAVLVGTSAKARKGTSWDHVKRLLRDVDLEWADTRIVTGLSSGEGVIWAIREPIEAIKPDKGNKGAMVRVQIDEGVTDKRLMVVEPEFASVLRVASRDGNTLTGVLRQAWDGGNLKTLTKNNACEARNPHVSVIGHTTRDDLLKYLDRTDAANGFGNRFLWLCAKRSKLLPDGGSLDPATLVPLVSELRAAIRFGREHGETPLPRDGQAASVWRNIYGELSEGRPGLCGAMVGRADAQVVRLSLLYALMDRSSEIRREHLEAALAVWDYAEASARFIFGAGLGDHVADEILRRLRAAPDGLTRTDISQSFGGHRAAADLARALGLLTRHDLAHAMSETTGGRPGERWFAGPGEKGGESEESPPSSASFASFAGGSG
jgi:hypothetical protein